MVLQISVLLKVRDKLNTYWDNSILEGVLPSLGDVREFLDLTTSLHALCVNSVNIFLSEYKVTTPDRVT